MARHERAGNRLLPAVISLQDGTPVLVPPRGQAQHSIEAGYRRGIHWRPAHCAFETMNEALYARGELR